MGEKPIFSPGRRNQWETEGKTTTKTVQESQSSYKVNRHTFEQSVVYKKEDPTEL